MKEVVSGFQLHKQWPINGDSVQWTGADEVHALPVVRVYQR
jgi:hypothetical protein